MDPLELASEPPRSRFGAAFNSIGSINVRVKNGLRLSPLGPPHTRAQEP